MPQIPKISTESNFIGGLKTEYTGLNFPENACTDTSNCVFSLVGDVTRRAGIDFELNSTTTTIDRTSCAITSYKWNNAGGDGSTQILVEQVGSKLYFYTASAATVASPLSTKKLASTVDLTSYLPAGSSATPATTECQYTDGNGYLFVFHPDTNSFYCSYSSGVVAANQIQIQTRDFTGVVEPGIVSNFRPTALTNEHTYNLQNQGWTASPSWTASSSTANAGATGPDAHLPTGNTSFTVASGITGVTVGQSVVISGFFTVTLVDGSSRSTGSYSSFGTVISYSGTALVINITTTQNWNWGINISSVNTQAWSISPPTSNNTITAWHTALGNYPSNADVWWRYKNSSGVFDPTTQINNVSIVTAQSPQGHFILDPFNWNQSGVSGAPSINGVVTYKRPRTGAWYSGRVFYAGVDDSQSAVGDQPAYSWTESIYFSQIVVNATQFAMCYQENDPTSEDLFDELPSDGGVINIQGSGSIYKLFPIKNGMLVHAANGIWFITGSQGIGFTATDYTITKISEVRALSAMSFVNVNGLPVFWNEEGIYTVEPNQQGTTLNVNPITVGTILSFYNAIPHDSKKYARGDYNPIDYIIQWTYRSTQESSVTTRYEYDSVLVLNTYNKAFYPYTIAGTPKIHGIRYVSSPGGSSAPDPVFKFIVSYANSGSYKFTFAEERDTTYLDWSSFSTGVDYSSYFVTGYKLHGQALMKWQPQYVEVYSGNTVDTAYNVQGIWDYAKVRNSGKYSSKQQIYNSTQDYFGVVPRRHRIRGSGLSFQLKVSSVTGQPFDIMGWSMIEQINSGV